MKISGFYVDIASYYKKYIGSFGVASLPSSSLVPVMNQDELNLSISSQIPK